MENPVLVEVTRGDTVESRHRGAAVVVDADGRIVWSVGDIERPVFPRSAVKSIQALPLIESGAADRFGFTSAEIALAVSSHSGEPIHAETALGMLKKAGRDAGCLECGTQWPMSEKASRDILLEGGQPSALNNNCSGKHAGFICIACELEADPKGYVGADHIVQREVKAALEGVTGARHDASLSGTDGCSIPTYAIPLKAMALGFARLATGHGLPPERAKAAKRIREAVAAHPMMVAGTGRVDTRVTEILGERAFIKTGAEGVYCGALPELGYGIALKCEDGSGRGSEVAMVALLERFLKLDEAVREKLGLLREPVMTNWNGTQVGRIRAVDL